MADPSRPTLAERRVAQLREQGDQAADSGNPQEAQVLRQQADDLNDRTRNP